MARARVEMGVATMEFGTLLLIIHRWQRNELDTHRKYDEDQSDQVPIIPGMVSLVCVIHRQSCPEQFVVS